ncbi:hypothetical protein KP79_PYT16204 [Mizuhopecten yessoensis]|uniref:Uncharacterized protein n=1 Tax=Mizuhopecten yessoensis TaxID=6573 RepID=A0A210PRL1_MIZYE|nr:hypothetical protein KP79_PYT16204 [Mizuhopecten yessoensis]
MEHMVNPFTMFLYLGFVSLLYWIVGVLAAGITLARDIGIVVWNVLITARCGAIPSARIVTNEKP